MISKKDLLLTMDISYGQLYRWKREKLIPDEWFKKVSVSTGQETFFEENLIIPRIKKILELKDKYSLEELRKILNPQDEINLFYIRDLYGLIDEEIIIMIKEEDIRGITINQFVILYALTLLTNSEKRIKYNKELFRFIKGILQSDNLILEKAVMYVYQIKDELSINIVHKPIYIFGFSPIWEIDLDEAKSKLLNKIKEKKR